MLDSNIMPIISKEDLKTYFNNERTISRKKLEEYIKIKESNGEKLVYGVSTVWNK